MYIYFFLEIWNSFINRKTKHPRPAGIKNPSGEKAIEKWGPGTDHPKKFGMGAT